MPVFKDIHPERISTIRSRLRLAYQRKSLLTAVILPILGLVIGAAFLIFLTLLMF